MVLYTETSERVTPFALCCGSAEHRLTSWSRLGLVERCCTAGAWWRLKRGGAQIFSRVPSWRSTRSSTVIRKPQRFGGRTGGMHLPLDNGRWPSQNYAPWHIA